MGVGCLASKHKFRPVLNLNKPTQQQGCFAGNLVCTHARGCLVALFLLGTSTDCIQSVHTLHVCLPHILPADGKSAALLCFLRQCRLSRCYATHGVGVMLTFLAFAHMVAATPRTGCGWGGGVNVAKESIPPGLHTLLGDDEVNPKTSVVQKVAGELH